MPYTRGISFMKLTENDWNFLNDLTFKIHSIPDLDELRYVFLNLIQILIPCDKLTFFLSDNEHFMYAPIQIGLSDEKMHRYMDEFWEFDYKKWIFMSGQNKAYRITDFFAPGVRESQPYYQKVYLPDDIHYEAILSLAYNNQFVGVVSLYRPRSSHDFTDQEIYILDLIKKHLAFRLYRELSEQDISSRKTRLAHLDSLILKYHLTARETDVLKLLLQGDKNPEICEKLFISASTLKKHTNNIYKKLGINSRVELFRISDM